MQSLEQKIQEILRKELESTKDKVIASMVADEQVASGSAIKSLHVEADNDSGALYGYDYIETLETGISPQESQRAFDLRTTQGLIYKWATYKPIVFRNNTERWWFASNTGKLQQQSGSRLFRSGGRKDVYSDKIEPLLESIGNQISSEFIKVKLVK